MIGIQLQIFCVHLQLCSRSSHEFLSDETHLHNMMHLATLMALLTTTIRNEGLPLAAGWDDCSCKCHDSLFLSEQALQNPMIMDETVPLGNSDHADNNLCWKIIDSYIMVSPFPHFFSPESPAISPRFQAWTGGVPNKGTSSVPAQRQKHRGVQREDAGVEPNPWPHIKCCFWYGNPSPQKKDLKCNSRVIFMTKRLYLGCARSEWLG